MQQLKPQLGVLLLIISRLLKDGRDLLIAILLGAGCIICVLRTCLRLPCKRSQQVCFCFTTLEFHCDILLIILIFLPGFLFSGFPVASFIIQAGAGKNKGICYENKNNSYFYKHSFRLPVR